MQLEIIILFFLIVSIYVLAWSCRFVWKAESHVYFWSKPGFDVERWLRPSCRYCWFSRHDYRANSQTSSRQGFWKKAYRYKANSWSAGVTVFVDCFRILDKFVVLNKALLNGNDGIAHMTFLCHFWRRDLNTLNIMRVAIRWIVLISGMQSL